jgi:hypothetical protein
MCLRRLSRSLPCALASADAHSVVACGLGCLLRLGLFRSVSFTDRFTERLADLRITVACATVPAVREAGLSLLRGLPNARPGWADSGCRCRSRPAGLFYGREKIYVFPGVVPYARLVPDTPY